MENTYDVVPLSCVFLNIVTQWFLEQFYSSYFLENVFSKHLRSNLAVDIRLKSNVHETSGKSYECLIFVQFISCVHWAEASNQRDS